MVLRSLQDSPTLMPLARAAKRAGVELELFGSVATRAFLFDAAKAPERDLFELAEHVADVDLRHTGPPSATERLRRAIAVELPMANWFRWSITDREQAAEAERLRAFNIGLPLRELRLGTEPADDTDAVYQLLFRALDGDIEIIPNDRFSASPRASRDTEATAALIYIDAAVDVLETQYRARRPYRPGVDLRTSELASRGLDRLRDLQGAARGAALRRLWYRLAGTAVRISPELFEAAANFFDLEPLIGLLDAEGFPARLLGQESDRVTAISAYLADGNYRVPVSVAADNLYADWTGLLNADLARSTMGALPDDATAPIELGRGNDVMAAIRSIPLRKGVSPSSIGAGPLIEDFFHLSMPFPSAAGSTNVEQLTAIVVGRGPEGPTLLPAFASVSRALPDWLRADGPDEVNGRRITIRFNLAGMVSDETEIDVFLVRADSE